MNNSSTSDDLQDYHKLRKKLIDEANNTSSSSSSSGHSHSQSSNNGKSAALSNLESVEEEDISFEVLAERIEYLNLITSGGKLGKDEQTVSIRPSGSIKSKNSQGIGQFARRKLIYFVCYSSGVCIEGHPYRPWENVELQTTLYSIMQGIRPKEFSPASSAQLSSLTDRPYIEAMDLTDEEYKYGKNDPATLRENLLKKAVAPVPSFPKGTDEPSPAALRLLKSLPPVIMKEGVIVNVRESIAARLGVALKDEPQKRTRGSLEVLPSPPTLPPQPQIVKTEKKLPTATFSNSSKIPPLGTADTTMRPPTHSSTITSVQPSSTPTPATAESPIIVQGGITKLKTKGREALNDSSPQIVRIKLIDKVFGGASIIVEACEGETLFSVMDLFGPLLKERKDNPAFDLLGNRGYAPPDSLVLPRIVLRCAWTSPSSDPNDESSTILKLSTPVTEVKNRSLVLDRRLRPDAEKFPQTLKQIIFS